MQLYAPIKGEKHKYIDPFGFWVATTGEEVVPGVDLYHEIIRENLANHPASLFRKKDWLAEIANFCNRRPTRWKYVRVYHFYDD
ncbi:hypothetical protein EM20IM_04865 [Candidatus Methylacidiphilum infernorum]|uniref:Uncharacterized protein n=1 Tax=Candidatus Methylacidiphilum infernorum TaxID=511746 RepID=A0ABX7PXE2_9BACT|nr:hypothetical protein [Candidatus Methylacidiphilum infernorum]QSR87652.1 hypothetical protein EM20IM_04865 [Candidatus Methylacidiphilum infernorum]